MRLEIVLSRDFNPAIFDVFGLDYYSAAHGSTASTVLNSEVYNSINFTQWNKERGTWYN